MKKFQKLIAPMGERNTIKIPTVYRKAICKEIGIDSLKGCILELNITVIYKDNRRYNLSSL